MNITQIESDDPQLKNFEKKSGSSLILNITEKTISILKKHINSPQ